MKFKVVFSMGCIVEADSTEEARRIAGVKLAQVTPADMESEVTRWITLKERR